MAQPLPTRVNWYADNTTLHFQFKVSKTRKFIEVKFITTFQNLILLQSSLPHLKDALKLLTFYSPKLNFKLMKD